MKYNKSATVKRLTAEVANPNIKSWSEVAVFMVFLLPLSNEMSQIAKAEGIIGKAYNVYADLEVDIQVTDRLVIDSKVYDVRGVNKFEGSSTVDHLEILIEKRKE